MQSMISLTQLKDLLAVNEVETVKTMRDKSPDSTQRLHDLAVHRSMIKDLIIETLESRVLDLEDQVESLRY